ncbi:MAG TPA: hypothetical protein VNW93_05345 [Mycobacterium sp.]|nr:hypothetical protein [Mycobacterium sp.]
MKPPEDFDLFESVVTDSEAPAVVMIDRALARDLIAYVRCLERRLLDDGWFW